MPVAVAMALGTFGAVVAVAFAAPVNRFAASYLNVRVTSAPAQPQTTYIYDRKGRLITTLHAGVNRTDIPLSEMSDNLKNAVIAVEDSGFYHEGGVSLEGTVRAAVFDLVHHRAVQGGSTITQQYVKLMYTGAQRTVSRKLKEAILAQKLSRMYSKDQILEKYLNTVYFGNGAYGAQAAAETYWGKPASRLNPGQAATLAAMIQAPADYDPYTDRGEVQARRNLVLSLMAEQGYLTPAEAAKWEAQPLRVRRRRATATPAAYFVDVVRRDLQKRYGVDATFGGGLRVTTTIDLDYERAAEQAIASHLSAPGDPSAALVAIDPATGAIRAMVGGRNFSRVKFNMATQARRQTGSAFKVFTFTAAMEKRIDPNAVMTGPPHLTIPDKRCLNGIDQPWEVSNYADESAGTMSLFQAIAHSVNTIFAQLVVDVGPANVATVARRMGIRSPLRPVCSITLGSQAVTPLDMAKAYATLAARGIRHPAQSLQLVRSPTGQVLGGLRSRGSRVLDQNVADVVTQALQGVISGGTGTAANIGRPAAGKTGTGQNFQDAWFCGYVPQLATCVWVGYPKGEIPMHNVEGFADVFGGSIPAEIWHDFMTEVLRGVAVRGFRTPNLAGFDVQPERIAFPPVPPKQPNRKPRPGPGFCRPHPKWCKPPG
jgi:penicillin-binding protein 1A